MSGNQESLSRCALSISDSRYSTLHHFTPLNEIFYRFSQPLHFCRFNTLALDGFRPNGARGAFPGAARKIRDAAGPIFTGWRRRRE